MYGVGARLDNQPELLFLLRGVDHQELVSQAMAAGNLDRELSRGSGGLGSQDLGAIFGIELENSVVEPAKPTKKKRTSKKVVAATAAAAVAVTPTKAKVGKAKAKPNVSQAVMDVLAKKIATSAAKRTTVVKKTDATRKVDVPTEMALSSIAKDGLAKARAASKKSGDKALTKSAKKKTGAAKAGTKRPGRS